MTGGAPTLAELKTCRAGLHQYGAGLRTCPECERESRRKYREAHRERERERLRKYHETHPERNRSEAHRESSRKYLEAHRESRKIRAREISRKYVNTLLLYVAELRGMPRVMCYSCGRGPDEVQLDLHHILQTQKCGSPRMSKEEAAKCIPLCHGMCHQAWHNAPRYKSIPESEYPQHMWDFAHDQSIAYTKWYAEQQETQHEI